MQPKLYLRLFEYRISIEEEEDTLFTNYGPTRGMHIHIYNYLKHNICLTKTKIQ
jgi:hypothetical protein